MSNSTGRIQIRKVNQEIITKIDRLASEAGLSREEYLRSWLTRHGLSKELTEQRFIYEELVQRLTAALESQNDVIAELASELRDIKIELGALRRE